MSYSALDEQVVSSLILNAVANMAAVVVQHLDLRRRRQRATNHGIMDLP